MNDVNEYIGVLTHCIADNYGANLQALSTASYLKKRGFIPVFFNWNPYQHNSNIVQVKLHETFLIRMGYIVTNPCVEDDDFLKIIEDYHIKSVIVGSDCVLTYKPQGFPYCLSKKGITRVEISKDYQFPNPFWLPFLYRLNDIKIAMMSASCGCSELQKAKGYVRDEMNKLLKRFNYITVRDEYTKKSLIPILGNEFTESIPVTPDPVFAFNNNVESLPNKDTILSKYGIGEKYVVIGFYDSYRPKKKWVLDIKYLLHQYDYQLVELPMPQNACHSECDITVNLPLDSIDWYSIIKYSSGYIGNNMHPIIVAMHNAIPFFSINHHGKYYLPRYVQSVKHTKEYELLDRFKMLNYHIAQNLLFSISTKEIIHRLLNFDKEYCRKCALILNKEYEEMMSKIISIITE